MIQSKHDKTFPTVPPLGPLRHLRGGALWRIGGWLHQQPRAPVGHRYRPTDGAELRGFPKGVWPWIQWIPWWSLMGDVSWVIVFIWFYMFLYVFICFYMFLYVFICFYMFLYVFSLFSHSNSQMRRNQSNSLAKPWGSAGAKFHQHSCELRHLRLGSGEVNEVVKIDVIFAGIFTINTSSTAQGGGGSFKNRKPIGEVGCCESGMAERSHWWTERCLRSPLFLSFSLCFSIFLWLSTYLPTALSVYLSICLSVYLSPYLSIYLPIYLAV